MRTMRHLLYAALLSSTRSHEGAHCSGHGVTSKENNFECTCFSGWKGPNCGVKACPRGRAPSQDIDFLLDTPEVMQLGIEYDWSHTTARADADSKFVTVEMDGVPICVHYKESLPPASSAAPPPVDD